MILKQEKGKTEYDTIKREPPNIGKPWKSGDPINCVAGYRQGPKNPYVEKLMQM